MIKTNKYSQKEILQSLSMDLLRAALGRHRGSHDMADRFVLEAERRVSELDKNFQPDLISKITTTLSQKSERQAEDLLMYSTLIRNRARLV